MSQGPTSVGRGAELETAPDSTRGFRVLGLSGKNLRGVSLNRGLYGVSLNLKLYGTAEFY